MTVPRPTTRATNVPAMAGGPPEFDGHVPLARPDVPHADQVHGDIQRILSSRTLTNGPYVRQFERRIQERLGVRNAVAVSSCTSGLMLLLRAAGLRGDVVIPSFTFTATAHAVAWNGLTPVFADIDARSLTLDPDAVRRAVGVRCSAVLATHTFGRPCDVETLTEVADQLGVRLFFDAAHALGARSGPTPVGRFGDAEVFSLSPTKMVVAGEGGIITTDDDELAQRCRIGRDYGNPGDYDCLFVGLNARMSEFHAAIACASLDGLDARVARRNAIAEHYRVALADIPGVRLPAISDRHLSTYKDLTVLVDASQYGMDAATLSTWLAAENIETRRYYTPPVHAQRAYRALDGFARPPLPVTDRVAAQVLTLPLWCSMADAHVEGVAAALRKIHHHLGRPSGAVPTVAMRARSSSHADGHDRGTLVSQPPAGAASPRVHLRP